MNHKISLDYIIFWSSILTFLVLSHRANGILTDSNDIHCTHIQCPTKCPHDSYLKSSLNEEEDDFEDYEDEVLEHDPYIEELDHFIELPLDVEIHDPHAPQNSLKERQKREVFFQEEIEKCCDDQICVCNKCEDIPKCNEGQVAIEIHEGKGVPGNCCSHYKCVPKEECRLGVKQTWWTNKCMKCFCFGENELCTQICPEEELRNTCHSKYSSTPILNGDSWKEGPCTSCTCEQGERRCFTPVCRKLDCKKTTTDEGECCPKCLDEEIDEKQVTTHCYSEYLQKFMLNGASWKEGSCTNCTCEQGERKCFTPVCPKLECKNTKIPEDECCSICVDEEIDEKPEIVHNKDKEIEIIDEDYTTESTTLDIPISKINEEDNMDVLKNKSLVPIIDDSLINETPTTSPFTELEESSSITISLKDIEEISPTLEPELDDLLKGNSSNMETTTTKSWLVIEMNSTQSSVLDVVSSPATSTEQSNSLKELELDSLENLATSTSEQPSSKLEIEQIYSTTSTIVSSTTEEPKSEIIINVSSSSSTEEIQTSPHSLISETTTESVKELFSEETTTPDSLTQENSTQTSTTYTEESSTIVTYTPSSTASTTAAPLDFQTTTVADSSSEVNSVSVTTEDSSTTSATESSSTMESVISSSTEPIVIISSTKTTTSTPLDSSTETSTEYYSPTTSSSKFYTTSFSSSSSSSSTSTTSSPFSSTSDATATTETSNLEELSSSSTTSAPEPLKPLFQPYGGDLHSEERSIGTQNQMRIIFDEIDYVVMIVLFIGSMLCISLGLIIRHTKNRKKMYSSIPNSETSLSQNSTNTVLTV